MQIVFFGTPDFAVPSLDRIFKSEHNIAAVVTAPDKERGRGRKVSYTPVKQFAIDNNIKCLQPESLKDSGFISELKELKPDVFVVIAFRILPREVYTIPQKGSFNLHGSLLPKYRGAAPIQWALINGEKLTGVTTFFLQDKVDTGNIIIKESIGIGAEDNLGTLHDKMSLLGADVIMKTLDLIESGNVEVKEQDDTIATPAPKISKELCEINWDNSAENIHNLIRGLSPFPAAFFEYTGKRYKIYTSKYSTEEKLEPGKITVDKKHIFVGCKTGVLEILEIQPEGRKRMGAEEFLRGYQF